MDTLKRDITSLFLYTLLGDLMHFIAHRGLDNHDYKENTIKALKEALKQEYISGVELDVRVSRDNKFVIYHNMSYVKDGIRKFIKNMKFIDLNNDGIDSLEQFLKGINTDKIILLDIKYEFNNNELVVNKIIKLLNKYQNLNIWVCSFNYKIVNKISIKSKCNVGLLIGDIINKNKDIKDFDFISLSKNAFNDIKTNKIKMIWTINNKKELNKYRKVDYVITDKAYLLR